MIPFVLVFVFAIRRLYKIQGFDAVIASIIAMYVGIKLYIFIVPLFLGK